ncbi:FAD binding domain-containing protein [Prauserella endophytica]|uniref:FAD-binding protein n=1 Tax=Prauserella endophytica TaxID=1592324 RepID=A0ABY2S421_9PSEU|nr:FAD binding domain-containing protein [Prauserella endophytica]TKG70548.1 FAD-binding protein [Prauserella endophytica]
MRPVPFDYADPATVAEVCEVMHRYGGEAAVLAGGQTLVAQLNSRVRRPAMVVDLRRVAGLREVTVDRGILIIGAGVTQRAVEQHPDTPAVLREALARVGHVPTRNRGTLGGSLAFGDPQGELPTTVLALDARVRVASVRGERVLAVADLWSGPFRTALASDELITAVEVPLPEDSRWAFEQRDFRRHGKATAVAGFSSGRLVLALGGVGTRPLLVDDELLAGRSPEAVGSAVRELVVPAGPDPYVSTGHRRQLAATATTAALHRVLTTTPVENS